MEAARPTPRQTALADRGPRLTRDGVGYNDLVATERT